ncbi:hypothetical protein CEXT_4651 [Caerostris extrusa]|uniref:Uncharacterized protein n=1 Tax=Caerostris extrusa TaxID=172846 RepID=A0AAV4NT76_CAEEX|nr:hypothetical protein CEXT_4651 [Caerostris extrusa]
MNPDVGEEGRTTLVELRSHKMMSPPSRHAGSETVERIREESIYHFQQDCLEKTSELILQMHLKSVEPSSPK